MNIYGMDGEVNLDRATHELAQSAMIRDEKIRRGNVAEISAAALLDIAASLRVLAAEAAAAMPNYDDFGELAADPDEEIEESIGIGDFVIGEDWETSGRVVAMGESEGAPWVEVAYEGERSTDRVWLDSVRLAPAIVERDGETIGDGETIAELPVEADEAEAAPLVKAVEDHVDEIDDDFDGDGHGEVASALDVLRANESERKAKKKAAKK